MIGSHIGSTGDCGVILKLGPTGQTYIHELAFAMKLGSWLKCCIIDVFIDVFIERLVRGGKELLGIGLTGAEKVQREHRRVK